jgi:phytoene dehydrogenase-like protein
MKVDVIIAGGGLSGLTSAAFLAKAGLSVLLCEKEASCGGLVNTFTREGFFFDGGARAIENSGALFPMVKKLGLDIPFVHNKISLGVEDQVIRVTSEDDLYVYQSLLNDLYPQNKPEIGAIIAQMKKIMQYMEVQYGIDNPVFLDMKEDRNYFMRVIPAWMVKYALTVPKISRMQVPVVDFLKRYTQNQSLLDIISQHFFQKTPAFFALSYLKLYLDYYYPLGGTGRIAEKMVDFIKGHGGTIRTSTEIVSINPDKKLVTDGRDESHSYNRLIWAADQKALYRAIDPENLADPRTRTAFLDRRALITDKVGNDSVFTLFLAVDLDPAYFARISSEHFFYTPSRVGQSAAGPIPRGGERKTIEKWLEQYLALTTYEIACPVLRDKSLAPAGKTGLIISVLFDYRLTKHIQDQGWYEEFKSFCEKLMIKNLDATIYPGMANAILQQFSSTPLTMQKYTGSSDGAIVGWAFTNDPMPAENRLPRIMNAIKTPIPGILQAGQWTYSPAGLPISLITGKMAADRVIKETRKRSVSK